MPRVSIILLLLAFSWEHAGAQNGRPARPAANVSAVAADESMATDSCTPEKPIAKSVESIHVRLWTAATNSSQYNWTATAGHIAGHGVEAVWDLSGAPVGYASATVRYNGNTGAASCSLQIVIQEPTGARGEATDRGHELLIKDTAEAAGYGLYSYVLLSAAPDDDARARCLQLMQAVLNQAPAIEEFGHYYDAKQLNVTYIPVSTSAQPHTSAEWLLDNYDYAHARFLLNSVPGSLSRGPYLISTLQPLGKGGAGPYLVQDLSHVPAPLVSLWTNEFLNQAAQQHFWEQSSGKMLVLRLRTAIGIMAEGLPDVRKSLSEWISLSK